MTPTEALKVIKIIIGKDEDLSKLTFSQLEEIILMINSNYAGIKQIEAVKSYPQPEVIPNANPKGTHYPTDPYGWSYSLLLRS